MKNFCEDLFFFFFWRALALVSLVLGLGLEHSCPWHRECLSSERLSLALASDFFVSLALASSLVSSTPPLVIAWSFGSFAVSFSNYFVKQLFECRSNTRSDTTFARNTCKSSCVMERFWFQSRLNVGLINYYYYYYLII